MLQLWQNLAYVDVRKWERENVGYRDAPKKTQNVASDSEIGEVSDDGLVTGLTLGSCKLVGRAVGRCGRIAR